MPRVRRSVRQKVIVAAAVAALLAGAALAAVSATGQGNPHRVSSAQRAARHRAHTGALAPAAAYLDVSVQQLSAQLRSGKTLAQIANSTSGKSEAGLVAALLAAKQAKLAQAAATLPRRVSAEVNRAGGPGAAVGSRRAGRGQGRSRLATLFTGRNSLGTVASRYLGLSASSLRTQLHAGKTLAQVADATPGKSSAGLVDALVAERQQRMARSAASGKLSSARRARRAARLQRHVSLLVQRKFAGA
jgi:hypothetical protein